MSDRARPAAAHLGPVLAGAMLGALVAGRVETALLCIVVALVAARAAGARAPSPHWLVMLGAGAALGWVLNLYLTPGRPLAGGWPAIAGRHATAEGLQLGLLLTLRFAGACTALYGLRAAWPGEQAADLAARWLAPLESLRVPVREARAMLGLSMRFGPLLAAEAERIARVQDLRAGRAPRGMREWLQRRRACAVPTLVGAFERAERVALALEARHYQLRPASVSGAAVQAAPAAGRLAAWTAGAAIAVLALVWRA